MQKLLLKIKNILLNKIFLFIVVLIVIVLLVTNNKTGNSLNKISIMPFSNMNKIQLDTNKVTPDGNVDEKYVQSWKFYKDNVDVTLVTNKGDIELELYSARAPFTVMNFVNLAKIGYYTDTKFHRVMRDFMIQGGDFKSRNAFDPVNNIWGTGNPGYAFADEVYPEDSFTQGVIAMANSGKNSNGSQFFIVTATSTPWLNGKHTIFGKVKKGLDVALQIQDVPVGENSRPIDPVIIENVIIGKTETIESKLNTEKAKQ